MPKIILDPRYPDPKTLEDRSPAWGNIFYNKRLVYSTPAYIVGRETWCCIVYEQDNCVLSVVPLRTGVNRFNHYCFVDPNVPGLNPWVLMTEHPRYDSNHGWAGLPHGLRTIWNGHQQEIEYFLDTDHTAGTFQAVNLQPALL